MGKHIVRLMAAVLAMLLLAACGGPAPAETTATTQTEPETTAKELEPVGSMLRHMSFNILNASDVPGFESEEKRNNLKSVIESIDPDTFGIQEGTQPWTDGLCGLLDNRYAVVGGHSDPKVEKPYGKMNAIFYKPDKFTCLDSGMYYLNGIGSYVENKLANSCSFALLERIEDGALIFVLNCHLQWLQLGNPDLETHNFEYHGVATTDRNLSRDAQVQWFAEYAQMRTIAYEKEYGKPVTVLMSGDYNINALEDSMYEHEYTRLGQTMAGFGYTETAVTAKELVTNQEGAKWITYRRGKERLDYIFANERVLAESFGVGVITADYTVSSDHLPVYVDYYIGQ